MQNKKEIIKVDKIDFMTLVKKVADLERAAESKKIEIIATPTQNIPSLDYIFECQVKYPVPPFIDPKALAIELQPKIDEFKIKLDQMLKEYRLIGVSANYLKVF